MIKWLKKWLEGTLRGYYIVDTLYYGYGPVAIVEKADDFTLTIKKEEWAPGIWAGIKDCTIYVERNGLVFDIQVNFVNMDTRSMSYLGPKMQAEDKLYLIDLRVEYGI